MENNNINNKNKKMSNLIPLLEIKNIDILNNLNNNGLKWNYTAIKFKKDFPYIPISKIFIDNNDSFKAYYWDECILFEIETFYNSEYQKIFESNLEQREILFKEKKWAELLLITPKKYRFELLYNILQRNDVNNKYSLFMEIYTLDDCGAKFLDKNIIKFLIDIKTAKDIENTTNRLEELPSELTLYRGLTYGENNLSDDYSWDLNEESAYYKAYTNSNNPKILVGTIKKNKIIEYIDRINHVEIIVDIQDVNYQGYIELPSVSYINETMPSIIKDLLRMKLALHNVEFNNSLSHDKSHTFRVYYLSLMICQYCNISLSKAEKEILYNTCLYHDVGRCNDCEDEEHGFNSAKKVPNIKNSEIIKFIISYHCINDSDAIKAINQLNYSTKKKISILRIYNILKDADGLDRVRFGYHELDFSYLRHPKSKYLVAIATKALNGLIYN